MLKLFVYAAVIGCSTLRQLMIKQLTQLLRVANRQSLLTGIMSKRSRESLSRSLVFIGSRLIVCFVIR